MFSLTLDTFPEVELLDHVIVLFLIFSETVIHSGCTNLQSLQQCTRIAFIHILASIFYLYFFYESYHSRSKVILHVVLACIFLLISDVQHFFMYLLAIPTSSLEKCPLSFFVHLLIDLLDIELNESFIYFG